MKGCDLVWPNPGQEGGKGQRITLWPLKSYHVINIFLILTLSCFVTFREFDALFTYIIRVFVSPPNLLQNQN